MPNKAIFFLVPETKAVRLKSKLASRKTTLRQWGNAVVEQYLNGLVIVAKGESKK